MTDVQKKMSSAYALLQGPSISIATFEHIRALVKGLHPEVDKKLEVCSQAIATFQKVQTGDIITLSAEKLPERSEEEKKRKKALLLCIRTVKDLKSEIKRVEAESSLASADHSVSGNAKAAGRIFAFAKGPFGIITIVAVIAVVTVMTHKSAATPTVAGIKTVTQVIEYKGKQIPLSELYVGTGADCDAAHYHAKTRAVTATDGTSFPDPEGCGFGKVQDTQIVEK